MLKKVFSIITTISISLCCCNIVFAEEIPIVTEHQERTITEPEEMLVVENLELEGYEKSYDEESGLYVFTQINDETNSLIYADANVAGTGNRASSVTLHENEHDYTEVVINNKEMGNDSISACCRTLIHELGHVFTLAHPTCSYESIMWQSSTQKPPKSDEITFHDAYGVYDAYNNARSKTNENDIETTNTPNVRIASTDYEPIENISDIDEMSSCVVKAKVLEGKENILYPGYGMGYTKINLEITDVYKGDLKVGDIIPFAERYFIAKDGTEIRRDGYSASEVGKEYLFYLGELDDGLYDPVCTVLGRYSLEDTQALSDDTESIEANIAEEYAPLYQQLKTEVMNLYKK